MATEIFLKIGDIKGESTDDRHKDEIEVSSWSWGVTQGGSTAGGTGSGTGRAHVSDLSFTHHFDKASPLLMQACATGQHIQEATLTERKTGKGQAEFLIIKLSGVMVTSVQASASADGLEEAASLRFAKVDLEYKAQKADGSLDAGVHFNYDITAHKEG
jgi:type VI secretion system secreted protein Hcp